MLCITEVGAPIAGSTRIVVNQTWEEPRGPASRKSRELFHPGQVTYGIDGGVPNEMLVEANRFRDSLVIAHADWLAENICKDR